MGMDGPLTAQALGRSPYEDGVDWPSEGDATESAQQYDHRGRPVNPETKRINRDIVRSHNEVMLVIGVAEPENPNAGPEAESEQRHVAYEDTIGRRVYSVASRCFEAMGMLGVHGLRSRILVYERYSETPFWELFRQTTQEFSIARVILPGAPVAFLSRYTKHYLPSIWLNRRDKMIARQCVNEIWAYMQAHMDLFVVTQRLGLVPSNQWFPSLSYFIPFTSASPIQAPPPLEDLNPGSCLRWLSGLVASAAPLIVLAMIRRFIPECKTEIWSRIFRHIPNTVLSRKQIPMPPLPPPPPPPPSNRSPFQDDNGVREPSPDHAPEPGEDVLPLRSIDGQLPDNPGPMEAVRRPSIFSVRGDDYASDEEDNEGITRTLISFDVEATEAADAPPGLWSAELRPSASMDPRQGAGQQPVYFDTMLTRLPALLGSQIFVDAIAGVLLVPFEATTLRFVAQTLRSRNEPSCRDIHSLKFFSGLNWTFAMNFFGAELLHLCLAGEVWAVATVVSQHLHMTEEKWKEAQEEERRATD